MRPGYLFLLLLSTSEFMFTFGDPYLEVEAYKIGNLVFPRSVHLPGEKSKLEISSPDGHGEKYEEI